MRPPSPRLAALALVPLALAAPLWWRPFAPRWPLPWPWPWPGPTAPTATATRPPTPTGPPTATATATPAAFRPGPVQDTAPYFSLRRPLESPQAAVASRFYPYGTDAGGAYLMHHGVDVGAALGTTVVAVADGRVVFAGRDDVLRWGPEPDFYGRLVVVQHAERLGPAPLYSLYGHLSEALVRTGDEVGRGAPLGRVGSEGVALGPHLHLELRTIARDYGAVVNPELLLEPLDGHGMIVGRVVGADGHALPGARVTLFALSDDGEARYAFETTTYPSRGAPGAAKAEAEAASGSNADDTAVRPALPGPAWRWDESFVFGDVPAGRYAVVCDAIGARAEVAVGSRGAVLVVLDPPADEDA